METENTTLVSVVPHTEDVRQDILDVAYRRFADTGFKKVTIDEIAAELGISKKTVYKFFSSKEEILREVVLERMKLLLEMFEKIQTMKESSVDKIQAISEIVGTHINEQWQRILTEVRLNAPNLFREIDAIIQKQLSLGWQKLFVEGQKSGWIRKDIDPVVFTTAYVGVVRELMKTDFLSKHALTESEVPRQVFRMFTEGVLTEKGRKR
ncbi:MAG: TetR/AcrR family transcriptional regulator [Bacteroidetes bacterium]|nr:TetR/AcrR family transcriptional regulator [Bacteroidota bacterium]